MKTNPTMSDKLQQWERWAAQFLLATTPFVISPLTVDSFLLPKYTWLALWGAFWLFLIVAQHSPRRYDPAPLDWPVATLLGVSLVSVLVNYHSAIQLRALIDLVLFTAFFYAFQRYWRQAGSVLSTTKILLAVCVVLSLYGILQDYGIDLYEKQSRIQDWRMQVIATFGNPNFLSGFLLIAFPVIFAYGLRHSGGRAGFLAVLPCVMLIFACHTVTFCVGSTIGLAGAGIALIITALGLRVSWHLPGLKLAVLLAGCVFAAGWYLADNPYNSHGASLYVEAQQSPQWRSGAGARFFNWRTTRYMINDAPLTGIGFGNYEAKHLYYQGINYEKQAHPHDRDFVILVDQPHFQLLETAAEVGPLGVLVLFWLLGAWLKMAWRTLRRDANPWFAWGAYAGCWVAIIHSFSSFPFHLPANAFLFTALASYLCMSARSTEPVRKPASKIVMGFAFACSFLLALQGVLEYSGNQYLRRALETRGAVSMLNALTAKQLNPFDPETHFTIGVRAIEQGWYERAQAALRDGLALREDHTSRKYLVRIYERQGRLQKAIEEQRHVAQINAAYPGHFFKLAELLRRAGEDDEAARIEAKARRMQAQIQ